MVDTGCPIIQPHLSQSLSSPVLLEKEKGTLQKHFKSIHKGERFPCPHCEYKATLKCNLNTHLKSIHKGEAQTVITKQTTKHGIDKW